MQVSTHYSRAPLTEAIIDIKVVLPSEVTIDTLADIYSLINDRFPRREVIHLGSVVLQPDATIPINATQQVNGFFFRSEDGLKIFQVTLNSFTFNRLAPYTSWEELRDDAKYLWKIYKNFCKPEAVTRVAVRFVNRFELPGPVVDLKDYLRIAPEVTPDLPKTQLSSFFMQLQIPQEDCILIVSEALVPPSSPETISVILDFDLFRAQTWMSDYEV